MKIKGSFNGTAQWWNGFYTNLQKRKKKAVKQNGIFFSVPRPFFAQLMRVEKVINHNLKSLTDYYR